MTDVEQREFLAEDAYRHADEAAGLAGSVVDMLRDTDLKLLHDDWELIASDLRSIVKRMHKLV